MQSLPPFDVFQIKQWFCYLADMNPPLKNKPGKVRPVVVVQMTDVLTPSLTFVPMTSELKEVSYFRVRINRRPGLQLLKDSDILIQEVHTLDRSLFIKELGPLLPAEIAKISQGLKFYFGW